MLRETFLGFYRVSRIRTGLHRALACLWDMNLNLIVVSLLFTRFHKGFTSLDVRSMHGACVCWPVCRDLSDVCKCRN